MFRDLKDGKGKTETTKLDEVVNPAKMLTLPDFIHASLMLWFANQLQLIQETGHRIDPGRTQKSRQWYWETFLVISRNNISKRKGLL